MRFQQVVVDAERRERGAPLAHRLLHGVAILFAHVGNGDGQLFLRFRVDETRITNLRQLALTTLARVAPKDIAFIKVGDKALVKVTAYDFSTYGGLDGKVVQVSADSIYDEVERQAYFNVIVETNRSFLVAAGRRLPIAPGMMTDTQIITGRKSVLSYLLKPVLKARSDALRER